MMFNVTFNNISVISWRSFVLMDETGENHRPITSHLSHNVVSSTPRIERDSNSQLIVELSLCQILKHCIFCTQMYLLC